MSINRVDKTTGALSSIVGIQDATSIKANITDLQSRTTSLENNKSDKSNTYIRGDSLFGTDLNTLKTPGMYSVNISDASAQHAPSGIAGWHTIYVSDWDKNDLYAQQICIDTDGKIYTRIEKAGTWYSWDELFYKSAIQHGRVTRSTHPGDDTWKFAVTFGTAMNNANYCISVVPSAVNNLNFTFSIQNVTKNGFNIYSKTSFPENGFFWTVIDIS